MLDTVRGWVDQILASGLMDAKKRSTLACVAAGIIEARSSIPSEIGRAIPSEAYDKHKIKQVDRFLDNAGFDVGAVSQGLLRSFNFQRHQRVLLALDWSTFGKFEVMTTSVVAGGRALPFHWTVINKKKVRMAIAQKWHVEELKTMLPPDVQFILLFDAGFDDVNFLQCLKGTSLWFEVRASRQVCIKPQGQDEWVNLLRHRFERGQLKDWGEVSFTKEHAFPIRLVSIHDHGQDDPWVILTNLPDDARMIVTYYGRRFETEETYKDCKDVRFGMQLKGTKITDPRRLSRLLAAQTVAYYLMVLCGAYGEEIKHHLRMQSNTVKHKRVLALWRVGRDLLLKGKVQRQHLLGRLWSIIEALSVSFGGQPCPTSG